MFILKTYSSRLLFYKCNRQDNQKACLITLFKNAAMTNPEELADETGMTVLSTTGTAKLV